MPLVEMEVRRYYPKGFKGKTYTDTYIKELEAKGVPVWRVDTAKQEVVFTREEQEALFQQCCDLIMEDTRWILDNLEKLPEFKVNWENYKK